MSGIEQATKGLTRRLSQAAAGYGPAADALERLGLSASDLIALPLDERVGAINAAIEDFVPAAESAAVAGQLFGEEGSIVMSRIDTATLRQATEDILAFGVVVSEQDADQIERTNDAISRLGLIWRGLSNQLAVAAAPALEAVANAMAAAALWVRGFATALVLLRGALIRTGIGALIVGAGELIYQFTKLVQGADGFGNALEMMGNVARAVWDGIKATVGSFIDDFRAMRADVEAIWLRLMAFLSSKWADFLGQIGPTFNAVAEQIGADTRIDWFGAQSYASMLDHAASNAGQMAGTYCNRAADTHAHAFDGVREAVDALRSAMRASGDEGENALDDAAAAATG